jgi:antitoxin MazE
MKARLVQIGNSRGVRLPKPMIEEAGLNDDVDIHVKEGSIIITSNLKPRSDWADSAKLLHDRNDDVLIDSSSSTVFDETEWQW